MRRDGSGFEVLREFVRDAVGVGEREPTSLSIENAAGQFLAPSYFGGYQGGGALIQLSPEGDYDFVVEFPYYIQTTGPSSPAGVIQLENGALIGLSSSGGASSYGTIYRLDPGSREPVVLHSFAGAPSDIRHPLGMPLPDADGTIYGLATEGVFSIKPDGTGYRFRALFGVSETPPTDLVPGGGHLVEGDDGALYGTAQRGGPSFWGGGIYRIDKENFAISTVYAFTQGTAPYQPNGTLVSKDGFLYGFTEEGGQNGDGALYRIRPNGQDFEILHHFASDNGVVPRQIVLGRDGAIYGVLRAGGAHERGVVFRYGEEVTLPPELVVLREDGSEVSDGESVDLGSFENITETAFTTLTLRNDGGQPLSLANFQVSEDESEFSINPPGKTTLAPGETTTLEIFFHVYYPGMQEITARWETNDPAVGVFMLPLRAFVEGAKLALYDGVAEDAPEIVPSVEVPGTAFLNLGAARRGQPLAREIRVANLGTRELTFSASNAAIEPYFVTPAMPLTLAPGSSAVLRIERDTTAAIGPRTIQLNLESNDRAQRLRILEVSGEVLAPEIEVTARIEGSDPTVLVHNSDALFGFPSADLGIPFAVSLTIANVGTAPLVLGEIRLPEGYALDEEETVLQEIAPGESSTLMLLLTAQELGRHAGWVEIDNDDFDESPFRFQVDGWVIAPEIAVYDGGSVAAPELLAGQAAVVDFGETRLGTSVTRSFTVESEALPSGDVRSLQVEDISVSAGFVVQVPQPLPFGIASGKSEAFQIRLEATAVGTYSGLVTIKNNDPDEAEFVFPITGVVTAPEIAVHDGPDPAAPELASGQTQAVGWGRVIQGTIGGGAARALTIANTGTAPLAVSSITVPPGYELLAETAPTIAPGASGTWTIRLTSLEPGLHAGSVIITSDDPDEPTFAFPVTGEIYIPDPAAAVADTSTTLNRQTGLREQTVRLTNDTTATVPAYRLLLSGLPAGVTIANATEVRADGTVVVLVRQPLAPFSSFDLMLEYASATRQPVVIDPLIITEVVLDPPDDAAAASPAAGAFAIERVAWLAEAGGLLLEFGSTPGRLYVVEYSDDGATWKTSPTQVRGTGNRTPWIDRGPPRTASPPAPPNTRLYRIRLLAD